ncbi:ABC transporter ATP-binding protein [Nocardia implantans]|uniref:ABC transporter ATP-binding protein n=1 Tax=Nocardia implantans TaxID=3108168 RepID=A0ABU6AWF3_9NOCA|nr:MULTISPECIES: ABC transporter ATP-binding protein [unclassified Nocardia]MBF6192824.1 ABC transporter ATP-binding protein [Nocardia beijingensis]MEA3531458.1 ABC transporter ATP-binding protein [Nocardia sp. CDC192]MEB3511806.1 ABC transporter ATP-binding protein [Nocardia sp. CDC186]
MALGITCSGLRREYAGVAVVDDVTFRAPAGRVTAVVGPNGAGKTTLLSMLAGQLRPHRGRLRVEDADPSVEPWAVRARVGWVPDVYEGSETWSVAEVVEFSAKVAGHSGDAAEELVDRALHLARLAASSATPVLRLSRSEKKWLGLAKALAAGTTALVLDNPMADLDDDGRRYLAGMLRALARQDMTIVVSACLEDDLAGCAEHILRIDRGRVVAG